MSLMMFCQLFLIINFVSANELEVTNLRNLYYQAAENEAASKKLSNLLEKVNTKSSPIFVCYKGAADMMEAKYAFNPISKLSKFKKGKNLIEAAIKLDPNDMEMRFLRFSIQTNLPGFLGYDNSIKNDKEVLISKIATVKDENLKGRIISYLSSSKYCTKEEIKKLKG